MSDSPNNANAYLQTKVMGASPAELRLMLLDGAVRFAHQGLDGLRKKDFEASFNGISQCRDIVVELMSNLRDDVAPDLCQKVRAVYTYLFTELTESSLQKDAARLERAIELIEYERETWVMLMKKMDTEAKADVTTEPATNAGVHAHVQDTAHEGGSFSVSA
ncbi:MAG: flagellar export chaperone FliS [Planctomycetota bacterium]